MFQRKKRFAGYGLLLAMAGGVSAVLPSHGLHAQEGGETASDQDGKPAGGEELDSVSKHTDQLIKTIQKKNFLKAKRFELTAFVGGETIDPFVTHWIGGLNGTYHLTEVFAIEGVLAYSPILSNVANSFFGASATNYSLDLKDLTLELAETASVAPQTSKMRYYGHTGVVYSPLYGKFAFLSRKIVNFDIYFMSGFGFVHTMDLDTDDLGNPIELETTNQTHFATNFGFGFRVAFNRFMAFRLDGREYFHIESLAENANTQYPTVSLHLQYYFIVQAGLSFFFPTTWR